VEFVHPVLGALVVFLSVWVMTRGLVTWQGGKPATKARRTHKRWAPWAYWGMLLAAFLGTLTTVFVREDLDPATTWHFWLGWTATGLMGISFLAIRYRKGRPMLRKVHPVLGGTAVVMALVQMLLGFELLP
jgi:hypothetical protein